MTRKRLEELALDYGLGTLSPAEVSQLEALMIHDAAVREDVAAFMDATAALAAASSPLVEPSSDLRARIFAEIVNTPQCRAEKNEAATPRGFAFKLADPEGWEDTPVPGFRTKLLSSGPGPDHQTMLVSLESGATIPEHDHSATEQLYILSGHLMTEGRMLGPGDFLRAEAGTHHRDLNSPDGCVALLIVSPALAA
ncbi:MAG: cupin domain-containing protein [Verrucomicrobia bacterium]|nr:cupin domain-containing protein [Verrucomicrobiota bacterium]